MGDTSEHRRNEVRFRVTDAERAEVGKYAEKDHLRLTSKLYQIFCAGLEAEREKQARGA